MSDISLRTIFNSAADRYHAVRPNYPPELFDKLIADTHLPKDAELLEIGPGTGQATRPFAERGYHITAVELGRELAAKALAVLADYPNVDIITGAFEEIALPEERYDLVYSATAIHWIKPEYKFAKPHAVLKPGGYLAIIHTEHVSDETGDAFFHASRPIFQSITPKAGNTIHDDDFKLPKLSGLRSPDKLDEALFSLESFTVFPLVLTYSSQEYVDLLATYSPNLALPEDTRAYFLQQIKELIDADFGGQMIKRYGMTLTIAQKINLT